MPKHQGPIQKLIDPFSIPAQMNNLGVLIVAYVAKDMCDENVCSDPNDLEFLNFIYYGSTIVCGGTFLMSLVYMIGLLDYCINKIMPCGEVCLTLNTLTIFFAGIVYHCVATVYGLLEMYWGAHSNCVEIEMFKRITCTIYLIWFLCILAYLLFNIFLYNRKRTLQTVEEQYIEM